MSDPFELLHDPDFVEWAEHQRTHVMPMIMESAATISLVPDGPADVKFAVELGMSIMLDKPIIAVIRPGQFVPPKLSMVADAVVEWDPNGDKAELMAALNLIMRDIERGEQ